jgi:hypothetical protein
MLYLVINCEVARFVIISKQWIYIDMRQQHEIISHMVYFTQETFLLQSLKTND